MKLRNSHLAWFIAVVFTALGSSPPGVVQVRVPAAKVSSWFPPGSDLRILTPERFDDLLRSVQDRPRETGKSRLLRARHQVRWEDGTLVGRSRLTAQLSVDPSAQLLILDPWSPFVEGSGSSTKALRATAEGTLGLKVEPSGPSTFEFDWRQGARPGSDGRVFTLALPDLDISSLELDLPSGLVPETKAGVRVGPEAGPAAERSIWRFEAARGRMDLRLHSSSQEVAKAGGPALWLEGPTRIDLNLSPVNWRADWQLDETPGAQKSLTIALDPGLELVDVTGPRVASFRSEADGQSSRVAIRLDGEGRGQSALTIRAICRAPDAGVWQIPSAHPLNATWMGGRTTVRLDTSRILQACREQSGRRIVTRASNSADFPTVVFEPKGEPGPLAELTFRKPAADATVEVRGHLRLGDDIPRMEVALTWTVERGRLLSHSLELPPGWTPDRVISAVRQPVPWHAEPLDGGGTRVQAGPSLADDEGRSLTLTFMASARQAGVSGLLDLPRARPGPGARIVDEIWAATPDPRLTLRPISARGLAWIDPPDPPLDEIPTPWVADDLKNALAWRWLTEDAEARIDRAQSPETPQSEVKLDALIHAGQVRLQWSLLVELPRGAPGTVPIHINDSFERPIRWRVARGGRVCNRGPTDRRSKSRRFWLSGDGLCIRINILRTEPGTNPSCRPLRTPVDRSGSNSAAHFSRAVSNPSLGRDLGREHHTSQARIQWHDAD